MEVMNCLNGAEATSSGKLPSSRYKGVVPQPNGRWGAQIYEKHQRVWLGTFNQEEEAAKAYDIALLRFRGTDAVTNFNPSQLKPCLDHEKETLFLESHSKAEIVDMLRKHSYANELEMYKHKLCNAGGIDAARRRIKCHIDRMDTSDDERERLFEKVATPSDVGRLNRMVIPKQQAEKHFPLAADDQIRGVLLNFEDNVGQVWRFRYCYWGSSQSYVLTKGWTRFVKEKKLRAGDVVVFERSVGEDIKLFIDCRPRKVDVPFEEMSNPVGEPPLAMVQDDGVVMLFGVNIVQTGSSCIVCLGALSQNKLKPAPISIELVTKLSTKHMELVS